MKQRANNRFLAGLRLFLVSLGSILALCGLVRILGDNTFTGFMIGFVVVFLLLLAYGWVELYRLWMRHFHRVPVSGVYQIVNLLVWLLLVGIMGLITAFLLRLFALF